MPHRISTNVKKEVKATFRDHGLMLITILGLAFALPLWEYAVQPTLERLSNARAYRDFMKLTPYHHVTVEQNERVDASSVLVSGTMIKRRCVFDERGHGLFAYASYDNQVWDWSLIDTSPEAEVRDDTGNRAPSDLVQTWGPWMITAPSEKPLACWVIYARHYCPENEGRVQTNKFAEGCVE